MIAAIALPLGLILPADRMRSASKVGHEIRQTLCGITAHFRRSLTFGDKWHKCIEALMEVARECAKSGWDGYAASPLKPEALEYALTFIRSIPFDLPLPEISATSAGEITFEWAATARRLVTVAVADNGEVHYACLNGLKKTFGSHPLDGNFEPELKALIASVLV